MMREAHETRLARVRANWQNYLSRWRPFMRATPCSWCPNLIVRGPGFALCPECDATLKKPQVWRA